MLKTVRFVASMALGLSACGLHAETLSNASNGMGVDETQASSETPTAEQVTDPFWRNATVYFLMIDRFANGDPSNDNAYGRKKDGDKLRSFLGGDLAGINARLESGYFADLGINAIWTTPPIEQIHQPFEEYGRSYAFHGYWPRDWTKVDEAYGTEADFARMVELAHSQGIRVLTDVIINHSGPPINERDPEWPEDWVRKEPTCDWASFAGVATCLIVPALQDIRTESKQPVELPAHLLDQWQKEGRLEQELAELDAFFERTGYPRAPAYYLIKWQTDWVREYGVDGYRIDTAKHIEPEIWAALKSEADLAFAEWKAANPDKALDDREFYMTGEVFNFGVAGFENAVAGTRDYDFGDMHVDFYDYGFDALINMGFATHARLPIPVLFQFYSDQLEGPFKGVGILNYISSHDDQAPLDPARTQAYESAIKLLLAPGAAQIYYGDELGRSLIVEGTTGDATLRSFMNWETLETQQGQDLLQHWQRLVNFRKAHPAIGAGAHMEHSATPYVFSRTLDENGVQDRVLVALGEKLPLSIKVHGVFEDGVKLRNAYSGEYVMVENGQVTLPSEGSIALLELAAE